MNNELIEAVTNACGYKVEIQPIVYRAREIQNSNVPTAFGVSYKDGKWDVVYTFDKLIPYLLANKLITQEDAVLLKLMA